MTGSGSLPGSSEHLQGIGDNDRQMHATLRSLLGSAGTLLIGVFIGFAPLLPILGDVLTVHWQDTARVSVVFVLTTGAATALYHFAGRDSLAYRLFNWAENLVTICGSLYLVYASGTAGSFFWVFYFGTVFVTANVGSYRLYNTVLLSVAPVCLSIAFTVLRRDLGSGVLTLLPGAIGTFMYWIITRASAQLQAVTRERERLQKQLAELQVREERARIARDLHDGLGAELSALFWRASSMQADVQDAAAREELSAFMNRVRQSTDELRAVVWALRAEGQRWPELVAHLRSRCAELCPAEVALRFEAERDDAREIPGELRLHIVRMVQEAVRNAVRHARPRSVEVRLGAGAGAGIRIEVRDDGCGIPPEALAQSHGGLRNLRHRAQVSGGTVEFETAPGGTCVRMSWPETPAAQVA